MRRLAEQAAISARFYRGDTAISLQEAEELFSYINQGLQAEMNVHKQSIRTELFQLARDVLDGKCSSMTPTDASQEVIYHHIYVDDIDPKVTAAAAQWGVIHTQENKHSSSAHLTPEEQEFVFNLLDTGFSIEQAFTVIDGWRGNKPSLTVEVDPTTGIINKRYSTKL